MPTKVEAGFGEGADLRLLATLRGRPRIAEIAPARLRQCMPDMTFSSTLISRNSRTFWKVRAMPGLGDLVRLQAQRLAAVEAHGAVLRLVEAGDAVEERGLAGAVGSDEADHGAGRHAEIDAVETRLPAKLRLTPLRSRSAVIAGSAPARCHSA
jgi:hypothetical protein